VIKFKTSATLLRNLFPNSKYFFEKPDTVATASYSIETLENMAWLGGGGYTLLALYVHGVNYREENGTVRKGVYCPIMLENLTDPILTGREELGVPKMYSDIDITRSDESSFVAKASWRGATWGQFELQNLQKKDASTVPTEAGESGGLLLHKYIPGTGSNKPDADYDVLLVNDLEEPAVQSFQTAHPADVRFEINKLGWKQLPTLHSVISRLADLPVLEVLEGSLTKTQGVTDLSNMVRLT
jgi:acetoacetate decarboxylase